MTLQNSFCDSILRIKNGYRSHRQKITIKNSKRSLELLKILRNEGFILGFSLQGQSIEVNLKYFQNKPLIRDIKYSSPLNAKNYISLKRLRDLCSNTPKRTNGLILHILSTSKGLLTDYQCIKNKIGGQLLVKIL